jgi:hypothetical protein
MSIPRPEFEAVILENGGAIAATVAEGCTHLIRL